jgi:hypothetical protein
MKSLGLADLKDLKTRAQADASLADIFEDECVVLTPDEGMLILDVVGETIACVEVMYRKDVRQKLDEVLP